LTNKQIFCIVVSQTAKLKAFPSAAYGDSRDWKEDYTVDKIVRGVCDNVKSGSIVLFHNAAKNTPEALPIIIEKLIAEGYRFELISNMIYKEGYEIIHNGTQVKK
jgi:peptidoglycan/xylan/chitin deacetylase (PgdA/CDA1 family)